MTFCINCKHPAKHSVKIEGIGEIPLCRSCFNAVQKGTINESDLFYMHKLRMNAERRRLKV